MVKQIFTTFTPKNAAFACIFYVYFSIRLVQPPPIGHDSFFAETSRAIPSHLVASGRRQVSNIRQVPVRWLRTMVRPLNCRLLGLVFSQRLNHSRWRFKGPLLGMRDGFQKNIQTPDFTTRDGCTTWPFSTLRILNNRPGFPEISWRWDWRLRK